MLNDKGRWTQIQTSNKNTKINRLATYMLKEAVEILLPLEIDWKEACECY